MGNASRSQKLDCESRVMVPHPVTAFAAYKVCPVQLVSLGRGPLLSATCPGHMQRTWKSLSEGFVHAENWGGTVRSSLQPVQRTVFARTVNTEQFLQDGGAENCFAENSKHRIQPNGTVQSTATECTASTAENVQSALAVCVRLRKK